MTITSLSTKRWRLFAVAAVVTTLAGVGISSAAGPTVGAASAFHTVATTRVLDTRPETAVGSRNTPLGANDSLDLFIPGLPSDATGVSVNVTVVDGTTGSFLTVYPTGDDRPLTSTINWDSSGAVANSANVVIPASHSVTIYNLKGTVNVVIDLLGFYSPTPVGSGAAGPTGPVGPQGPTGDDAQTSVGTLSGSWTATNPSVSMTPDGVEFGPYTDGGSAGGSVLFDGLNGLPLSAVESLSYYIRYVSTGDSGGVGVPYLRIFTQGDTHDAIFSPNTQAPDPDIAEGPFHEWVATSGSWRYDDDAGFNPDVSYASLIGAHGADVISGIYISTGFSSGVDLAALLRWVEINGDKFVFQG